MRKMCEACGVNEVSCLCTPVETEHAHGRWPLASASLAENDIAAARERCKRHGVTTDFNSEGCPVFTSLGHQRQYMRMLKSETGIRYVDKSGWY